MVDLNEHLVIRLSKYVIKVNDIMTESSYLVIYNDLFLYNDLQLFTNEDVDRSDRMNGTDRRFLELNTRNNN